MTVLMLLLLLLCSTTTTVHSAATATTATATSDHSHPHPHQYHHNNSIYEKLLHRRRRRLLGHEPRQMMQNASSFGAVALVDLSSYLEIQARGIERRPPPRRYRNNNNKKNTNTKEKSMQFDLYPKKLRLPTNDDGSRISSTTKHFHHDDDNQTWSEPTTTTTTFRNDDATAATTTTRDMDGSLVYIGRNKHHNHHDDNDNEQEEEEDDEEEDRFATHLNWATTNNPDGVPIVHDPIDQGNCGSCWALAATGSIEANAARRTGHEAYQRTMKEFRKIHNSSLSSSISSSLNMDEIYSNATLIAQNVEREALDHLDLSIQELIDCDTSIVDHQGCVGGNPLLAFYFVHQYGLTSSDQYPYIGKKDVKCHKRLANTPIATVEAWGIIPPNSERHMELVLRYIGPMAVGFNGADPSFLSYRGGIYDNPDCHVQPSNHALLVVGYGEEEEVYNDNDNDDDVDDGTIRNVIPYWIARNSWGTGWGENGYVRIRRATVQNRKKKHPGQCGINRSPSVALGGTLLIPVSSDQAGYQNNNDNNNDNNLNHLRTGGGGGSGNDITIEANDSSFHPLEEYRDTYTIVERICVRLGHQSDSSSNDNSRSRRCFLFADYVSLHKAMILGLTGLLATMLVVVWPLTWDCRRRAHRRRIRRKWQQQLQQLELDRKSGDESLLVTDLQQEQQQHQPDDETSTLLRKQQPNNGNRKTSTQYGTTTPTG